MARGTKNYFRHSNNAFDDEKIQKAVSYLGYEGYAFYFIILEMCAKQCENEFKNPITFHKQSIRNVLRKQSKSCDKVLTKLQESGLFVVTFSESFYHFNIPNLAKYMGKYDSKCDLNVPNKRKEKENKLKESKVKEKKFDFENVWMMYPKKDGRKMAEKYFIDTVKNDDDFNNCLLAVKNYCESVKSTPMKYIKNGSTFFNNWKDWINMRLSDTVKSKEEKINDYEYEERNFSDVKKHCDIEGTGCREGKNNDDDGNIVSIRKKDYSVSPFEAC